MPVILTAPVSVVIPCWRSADTIRRAVISVARQTRPPAEVLLVDDFSDDNTLDKLKTLASEYPADWIKVIALQQNQGPGVARNAGWDQSTQTWVAFLDADDAWHPKKIELQLKFLADHPDAVLCGHTTAVSSKEGQYSPIPEAINSWRVTFTSMLIANRFPTRSVILKRDLPYRFKQQSYTEDYLLWLQIILGKHAGYRLEAPLAVSFREDFSPGGYSGNLWRHEKRELKTWWYLYRSGQISILIFLLSFIWSLTKYLRRIFLRKYALFKD